MFDFIFFPVKDNEVAEAQPPPVVLYPHSPDHSQNNGASQYSQGGSVIRPIETPPPVERRYPPQYEPRFPDQQRPSQTDGRLINQPSDGKYAVTPQRRPNPPVPGPVETSTLGVSGAMVRGC